MGHVVDVIVDRCMYRLQNLRHEPHAPDGRGDRAAGGLDDDGDFPGARVLVEEGEHAWHVWCDGGVCFFMTNALYIHGHTCVGCRVPEARDGGVNERGHKAMVEAPHAALPEERADGLL